MSGWRKIVVDNVEYRWRTNGDYIFVREPERGGKLITKAPCHRLVGCDFYEWQRMVEKKQRGVTPKMAGDAIKNLFWRVRVVRK